MQHSGWKLLSIAALIIVICGIYAIVMQKHVSPAETDKIQMGRPIAPPSAAVIKQLQESKGFQALVSFTDDGFEGATTTIKAGQSVRFTDNSSASVWIGEITPSDTPQNPNTQSCDVFFNSCHALQTGEFIEFSFPNPGIYYYMDNLDPSVRGAIVVK